MKNLTYLVISTFFITFSVSSFASTGDTFGINSDSLSFARSNVYTDSKSYSAKDNPAGLTRLERPTFSFSYIYSNFNLSNANAGRVTPAASGIVDDPYNSSNAGALNNLALGIGIPLGKKLSFGFTGLLPTSSLASVYTSTKNEVRYLLYDDRSQRPEIYSAFGLKINDNVQVGAGLFYTVKADGRIQMGMSNTDADARTLIDLRPELIPFGNFNIVLKPFTFGLFYRAPQKAKTVLEFDIDLDVAVGSVPFSGGSTVVPFYDPQIIAGGVTYDVSKSNQIHLALRRSFWSEFKSPIIKLSGGDLDSYTGGNYKLGVIELEDTWDISLGYSLKNVELIKNLPTSFKFGLGWHESALPDAPKSLSIVDTERIDIAFGTEIKIGEIKDIIENGASIDIGSQYSLLKNKTLKYGTQSAKVGKNIITLAGGVRFEY